ncbi:unnamed protein product [Mytilus coruscus]|uniref:Ig-like domain-containing protein n=1 Tax=Mytilus coruscus TaxID=42192 RepID=A0A6J8DP74_MYTCO|nr:unnamed protein product [Mytilus coruscus]
MLDSARNTFGVFKPKKRKKVKPVDKPWFDEERRVALTNITNTSTNATLKFHILKCTDEKDYMCKYNFIDMDGAVSIATSKTTRILVKVPVRDVHIKNVPNEKQYDRKTDNITLTCKASGDPEPKYMWFKEDNKISILSWTNIYVIEDVIRNNSGLYICQAYNIINNIKYRHSSAVEIDIVLKFRNKCLETDLFNMTALVTIKDRDAKISSVSTFKMEEKTLDIFAPLRTEKGSVLVLKTNKQMKIITTRDFVGVPAVTVIYSEVNEHTKFKNRLTKNQATSLQHNNEQHDAVDGEYEVCRNPTLKYNMITGS